MNGILGASGTGKDGQLKKVRTWLKENLPNLQEGKHYELRWGKSIEHYGKDLEITYTNYPTIMVENADVVLVNYSQTQLPDFINFGHVLGGSFICSHSKFTSMRGFPKVVGRYFDCSFCDGITSLEDAPKLVDISFVAIGCGRVFAQEEIQNHCKVTCKIHC